MPDEVELLGYLLLLTVANARAKHGDLLTWFSDLGLNRRFMPPAPRHVDAFKKATSNEKITFKAPWLGPDVTVTSRWVEDHQDDDKIVRRAERTVAVGRRRAEPETVAWATFYKRDPKASVKGRGGEKVDFRIEYEKLVPEGRKVMEQWITDIYRRYEDGLDWIDTNALRAVVRNYLINGLGGLLVRDGTYFLFERTAEVDSLSRLVRRFGNESFLHPVPLQDNQEQRRLLTAALKSEMEVDAVTVERGLRALCRRFEGGAPIPARKAHLLIGRYEDLMTKLHDYSHVLGVEDDVPSVERLTEVVSAVKSRVI